MTCSSRWVPGVSRVSCTCWPPKAIGGPVPAGYNPNAKEIYAECLRIPPVKIWDKGKPRKDVINMILTNMRARRDQEGDFNALMDSTKTLVSTSVAH